MSEENQEAPPPQAELLDWTLTAMKAQALFAAAELGVADHLVDGPLSSRELAQRLKVDETFLYRLLRALSGYGVFRELPDRRFQLNEKAACLRSDVKESLRGWVRMRGQPWVWNPWGAMVEAVRTGQSAVRATLGEGLFDYFSKNLDQAGLFDEAMASVSGPKFQAVAEAYDFSGAGVVVDVGGGTGGQLMAILRRNSDVRGVIAEVPAVVDSAKKYLAREGFSDRIRCEVVDMFEAVPDGGDIYLMGHILHDWDDACCVRILQNCESAMNEGGRVVLVEHLIPEPNTPDQALAVDLEMMIMTEGGVERRLIEYDALFEAAGLRRKEVFETGMPWRVIEAVRS